MNKNEDSTGQLDLVVAKDLYLTIKLKSQSNLFLAELHSKCWDQFNKVENGCNFGKNAKLTQASLTCSKCLVTIYMVEVNVFKTEMNSYFHL